MILDDGEWGGDEGDEEDEEDKGEKLLPNPQIPPPLLVILNTILWLLLLLGC